MVMREGDVGHGLAASPRTGAPRKTHREDGRFGLVTRRALRQVLQTITEL